MPTQEGKRAEAEFREAFPQAAGMIEAQVNAAMAGTKPARALSVEERQLMDDVAAVHEHMGEIGPRPATIINLLPVPLDVPGKHTGHIHVPACPIGTAFVKFTIDSYTIDTVDKGGTFTARPVTAIQMARDFQNLQFAWGTDGPVGGRVIYMGDHEPNKQNMEAINEARNVMKKAFETLVRNAEYEWNRVDRTGKKNIGDIERLAAQWLHYHKYLRVLPVWVMEANNQIEAPPECPSCGAEVSGKGFSCKACAWILDPEKAYSLGAIGPEDASLSRLSRETLDKMGLKEVQTLAQLRKASKEKKQQ